MKKNNKHTSTEFPNLEKLKNINGFTTPKGYFEALPNDILKEITHKPKKTNFVWRKTLVAAALVLFIVGISFFIPKQGIETSTELDNEIEFESLTASEFIEDFSEIDLELEEELLFDEMAIN